MNVSVQAVQYIATVYAEKSSVSYVDKHITEPY